MEAIRRMFFVVRNVYIRECDMRMLARNGRTRLGFWTMSMPRRAMLVNIQDIVS